MKTLMWLVVALLGFLVVPAPSGAKPAAAETPELLIAPAALAQFLRSEDVVVLHVAQGEDEYMAGHVPEARFLNLQRLHVEHDGIPNEAAPFEQIAQVLSEVGVEHGRPVVVYDLADGLLAARAFFLLEYAGHERVRLLDGGMPAWIADGRLVTKEVPLFARSRFEPRPRPEIKVDTAWVRLHLGDPSIALIDSRPPDQFRGDEAGAGVQRPGHIPGAKNLFWRWTLTPGTVPSMRSEPELRSLFERAGAAHDRTLVTYCRTGMQSSHGYFVARLLGHQVKLYDASYIEWSRISALPVERGE